MPFQQHPDWCSTEQMGTIAWPGWNIKLAIIIRNIFRDFLNWILDSAFSMLV